MERLARALAFIIGTESMIVCKDGPGLDADAALSLKLWTVDALLRAALAEQAG